MSIFSKSLRISLKKFIKHNWLFFKIFQSYYILDNIIKLRRFKSYPLIRHDEASPSLQNITSQLVSASQCFEPGYARWCKTMRTPPRMHRKQWEWVFILEALRQKGYIAPGKRGVGFGCGQEPLSAVLASLGCQIMATDFDLDEAARKGWANSGQHASSVEALNQFGICPDKLFSKNVSFQTADMNHIPTDLRDYDFLWSSCALEHLGSIEKGLYFIINAMDCLKNGGIAVHTTEYNLNSNEDTLNGEGTCLFRKSDFHLLKELLENRGFQMAPINFNPGAAPIDNYVDLPPFCPNPHLKAQIQKYATTSIGLIVYKPA